MTDVRTPDERRLDAALLLTLWARCADKPREDAGDKLWQMKLAFLASRDLGDASFRALSLSFYRWTWGPMSNEVYAAWSVLERAGLLDSEEHFVLTRAGESLAREFHEDVVRDEYNTPLQEVFTDIEQRWKGEIDTPRLLDAVYDSTIVPVGESEPLSIRQIRKGIELIEPPDPVRGARTIQVSQGWLETLALVFGPGHRAPLEAAVADFREGRFRVA